MQNMKRVLALFVALVMCMSVMSLPAFAEYETEEPAAREEQLPSAEQDDEQAAAPEEDAAQAAQEEAGAEEDAAQADEAAAPDEDAEPTGETEEPSDEDEEPVETADDTSDAIEQIKQALENTLPETNAEVKEAGLFADDETAEDAGSVEDEEPVEETEDAEAAEEAEEDAREQEEPAGYPKADTTETAKAGGYVVTASVPAFAFPVAVRLSVSAVEWAELDDATAELLKSEGMTEDDALLDICFVDGFGYEWEPAAAVSVSIAADEAEIAEVYHVEDGETVTRVAEDVEDVAEFEVEGFSLFAIKAAAESDFVEVDDVTTLAQAIARVTDGGTVKLLGDVTLTSVVTINKSMTLDLNGCTITTTVSSGVQVQGDVTISDSSVESKGTITGAATLVKLLQGSTLTISGGTIAGKVSLPTKNCKLIVPENSTAKINQISKTNNTAVIDLAGGWYITSTKPAIVVANLWVRTGYKKTEVSDAGIYNCHIVRNAIAVAEVNGTTSYDNIATIIAAVPKDGTETEIKLLSDVSSVNIKAGQNVVIDLNGYKITNNGLYSAITLGEAGSSLKLTGSGTVTSDSDAPTIKVCENSRLEIAGDSITISWTGGGKDHDGYLGDKRSPIWLVHAAKLTVNAGTTIIGKMYGITLESEASVEVKGGSVSGGAGKAAIFVKDPESTDLGKYPGDPTITITGGTFSSDVSAYTKAGYGATAADGSYTVVRQYTVTFNNEDGTWWKTAYVNEGARPTYTGTPAKADADGKAYVFSGWKNGDATYTKAALPVATEDVTYTAVFAEKQVTEDADGSKTIDNGSGSTTRITESGTADNKTVTAVTTNGDGSKSTTQTNTVKEAGSNDTGLNLDVGTTTETTVVSESADETTTEQSAEVVRTTRTADAVQTGDATTKVTYTVTTTVQEATGGSASTSVGSAVASTTKTTVTVEAKESAPVVVAKPEADKVAAVETAAASASNTITADKVKSGVLSAKLTGLADSKKVEGKTVQVDVALTLETTLTDYEKVESEAADAATITYEVKPYLTTTVTVSGSGAVASEPEPVANNDLTGSPVKVKLPILESFYTAAAENENGEKILYVKHTSADYGVAMIEAKAKNDDGYYAEFEVTHFSSFEIINPSSKVVVTFDSAGGSGVAAQTIDKGETVSAPANPTRAGYTFNSWTLGGDAYDFTAPVDGNITLVASWTQIVSLGGGDFDFTAPGTTTIEEEETPLSDYPIFYADVATDDWYHDAIAYVTALGVMGGVGDDRFAPESGSTRGMVATILMRLAEGEAVDLAGFSDVADSDYYADAAAWAVANGIYGGYADGTFRGGNTITREEFATVLYRYAILMGYDVSARAALDAYDDGTLVSGYASEAMAWAVESGIINGVGDSRLDPTGSASRAVLATMLMRFDELTKADV